MYKVKLFPSKCKKHFTWMWKRDNLGNFKYKEGQIYDVLDWQFNLHKNCGCMVPIEHYQNMTKKKYKCKCCGQIVIERERVVIEKW